VFTHSFPVALPPAVCSPGDVDAVGNEHSREPRSRCIHRNPPFPWRLEPHTTPRGEDPHQHNHTLPMASLGASADPLGDLPSAMPGCPDLGPGLSEGGAAGFGLSDMVSGYGGSLSAGIGMDREMSGMGMGGMGMSMRELMLLRAGAGAASAGPGVGGGVGAEVGAARCRRASGC